MSDTSIPTKKTPGKLKGNPWWAIAYAMTSLRNYPIRNIGIALILSIGVALPTTVFVWTTTGTDMVVDEYFDSDPIQMTLTPRTDETAQSSFLLDAENFAQHSRYIESTYVLPSTIGILVGDFLPTWSFYSLRALNYAQNIKDGRVILVTNYFLGNASNWFRYEGKFNLTAGEVLVSEGWVDYTFDVHGINVEVGDEINIDLLRYGSQSDSGTPAALGNLELRNLTVAGIYSYRSGSSLTPSAFPSFSRLNWDPFGFAESVLGIRDSILMLESDFSEEDVTAIINRGWFDTAIYLRPDKNNLKLGGAANIVTNLVNLKTQIESEYAEVYVDGLYELWRLSAFIGTYLNSQVLSVIALPILIMSMMLTVFTSETSVARRKGEISALRAKGASFNQVFATFMWESVLLSIMGLMVGLVLAVFMAPLIASSTGLFSFDFTIYTAFLSHTQFSFLSIVIAIAIAMYLPAAYLIHVARRIDVSEIGQPSSEEPEETTADVNIRKYGLGLASAMAILFVVPLVISPTGATALVEILIATLLLFAAAYLGSRFMQIITAKLSSGISFIMGEKSLYLSQSLRRRTRQFVPLLIILTLTLTTTMMMVIQSTSFEATMDNEIRYALGGDMRVECDSRLVKFNETLMTYSGIQNVSPVIETWGQVGSTRFSLMGVDPEQYLAVGAFTSESFVSGTAAQVLHKLENTSNGLVISQYHSLLWNKTIGDEIRVHFGGSNGGRVANLVIVGTMISAPGLGLASSTYLIDPTIGSIFGFQTTGDGFALTNLDFLNDRGNLNRADLFIVDTLPYVNLTSTIHSINNLNEVRVLTPSTFNVEARSYSLGLFLAGFQGLTMIGFVMCTIMGLSALVLFLGSAVLERKAEYALFRSLGGTQKQVVSMVFGEFAGSVVTSIVISAILGIFFGYSLSILSFGISPFSPILLEVLAYPVVFLLGILVLESVVMLLSCYIPAKRAGATNPATTLRNL